MKIAKKYRTSEVIRKICEIAGRMQKTAKSAMTCKVTSTAGEITGVEFGNEIARILPEEFGLLLNKKTKPLFDLAWMEENLFQSKITGKEPLARGPVVVCIDESGSTSGAVVEFEKAFLFGMWLVAAEQKRPFYVIRFAYHTKTHEIQGASDMLEVMESFLSGGTDFNKPLTDACDIIEGCPKFKAADLIFLTDGGDSVSPEVLNRVKANKERLQFRIIGGAFGGYTDTLKPFCDRIFALNTVADLDNREVVAMLEAAFTI
jgi:uncharacterized protein with von Willebrand factor type A (vWA) domain